MNIRVRQRRLDEDVFLKERQQVLSQWHTGRDVDLGEAVGYQRSLPGDKKFSSVMADIRRGGITTILPRGARATVEGTIELHRRMTESGVLLKSVTTDSYSRAGQFQKVQAALDESIRTGQDRLNGYPLVNQGVANTRKVIEGNGGVFVVFFNFPDNRLLAEIAFASGITAGRLDPLEALGSYTKSASPEECIRNYQYVYRLVGHYAENGVFIAPDPIAWMPNGPFPFSIPLAGIIIDCLIAAEQGVKILLPTAQGMGNLAQDIASIRTTRKLVREYLDRFNYRDVEIAGIDSLIIPIFPAPRRLSTAITFFCYQGMIAALGEAEVCSLRTVEEAIGVATDEGHATTYEMGNWILSVLRQQRFEADNRQIATEQKVAEAEVRAIMDRVLEMGDGDVTVGTIKGIESGIIDLPMPGNIHFKDRVMGIRDSTGACRFLEFGSLPIPDEIKDFHREKVAERESIEGKKLDYFTSIEDFWSFAKGRIVGTSSKPLVKGS